MDREVQGDEAMVKLCRTWFLSSGTLHLHAGLHQRRLLLIGGLAKDAIENQKRQRP